MDKKEYKNDMFDKLSRVIEETGQSDPSYDNYQKAIDVLDVLEGLLAYAIYSTSNSPETVRDSCEESFVNIKKRALKMMANEQAKKN